VKAIIAAVPEQIVWLGGVATAFGIGFTIIVAVIAGPGQPLAVGVMVKVTVTGALVRLFNTAAGTLPAPLAGRPVTVATLSLTQLYTVPATAPVNTIGRVVDPVQIVCVVGVAVAFGVGFTSTVAVIDGPLQPLAAGVIVNVTVIGILVVLVSVPEILPDPLAAIPVTVTTLSLVQLYTVPATGLPLKTIVVIATPEQTVWLEGTAVAVGVGFTVTVAVIGVPAQPLAVGVMVKVTVTGAAVVLFSVPLILPAPLAAIPVTATVLSLTQLNTVPATVPFITIVVMARLLQIVCADGVAVAVGVGFTSTVAVITGPLQPLAVGVMVNVTVIGALVVLVSVPAILPDPDAAMPLTGPPASVPLSLVQLYTTPATALPLSTIVVIATPEQTVCEAGVAVAVGVGFTSTVAVIGVPAQPLAVGVIVKVTVTGAVVVLVSVPEILPAPLAAIPVAATVLSLTQLNTVPATLPVITIVCIATPEHLVCDDGAATAFGVGLTKTVAVIGVPGQPLAVGVMVKVTVTGTLVVLVSVPAILPAPLAAMPVTVATLSLTQLYTTPTTALPLSTIVVIATPEQTVCEAGAAVTVGVGFTSTVAVIGAPAQPLAVGVMVKVTVCGDTVVLVNVPLILPAPLAAMPVTFTLLSLTQLNTVPATLPLITIVVIATPEHTVCDDGAATAFGVGLTSTVAVIGVPLQPLAAGVMVKVTVTGTLVVLVNVPAILPAPLAAMPVTVATLSLVQLYTVPATALPLSTIVVIGTAEQTV
jgi:hypothetical protein